VTPAGLTVLSALASARRRASDQALITWSYDDRAALAERLSCLAAALKAL
jgi:hypothetical protein